MKGVFIGKADGAVRSVRNLGSDSGSFTGPGLCDGNVEGRIVGLGCAASGGRSGSRCGVLLPDIDGVDTPGQQLDICRQKAGIDPGASITIERFGVTVEEQP